MWGDSSEAVNTKCLAETNQIFPPSYSACLFVCALPVSLWPTRFKFHTTYITHVKHTPSWLVCVCVVPFWVPALGLEEFSLILLFFYPGGVLIYFVFLPVVSLFNLYFVFSQASLFKPKKYIKCLWALLLTVYSNFFFFKKKEIIFKRNVYFFGPVVILVLQDNE